MKEKIPPGVAWAWDSLVESMRARRLGAPWTGLALTPIRAGLIALNLIVLALCVSKLEHSRRMEIGAAQMSAVAATRLLEHGASATFDKASIALNGVAAQLEQQMDDHGVDRTALWSLVDAATAQVEEVERIGVFDTSGRQICGEPLDRCRHIDISDRAFFAQLRDHPETPPALHGPFLSKPANVPSLIMARALRTHHKAFAGVVLATIPLARLTPMVAAAQFGPNGAASLRMADMQVIARASRHTVPAEFTAPGLVSAQLREELLKFPEAGSYRAIAAADGVDRVAAYRKLPDYPVYALVGEATEDFLVAWQRMAEWTGAFMVLILLASLLMERMARTRLKQQDQAQRLYDQAPCGYHTLDADGRYLSINTTELQWLGCTRQEVIGKLRPTDFFTAASQATFAVNFPKLKRTGQLNELQLEVVGRHGEVRHVLVDARAVTDAQGRFVMSNSVMHDISALHRMQGQLRASARLQSLMLDTELVGLARLKGRVVVWTNRGMDRIFGYQGAEWHHMPARQLQADHTAHDWMDEVVCEQLRAGQPCRAELPLRRKDGSLCWMDIGAQPLMPEEDEVMLLFADISAQKYAEAARLREVQLKAHNEQLAETSRLKDEFLAQMSHELRTPLNAVIGFAQLLEMGKATADSSQHASYVRQISDSGKHLLSLVQTMLDFVSTAFDKMSFDPSNLCVQEVLDDVVGLVSRQALEARIDIQVWVEPGLDQVVNDALRLRQMLLNLLDNALKFSQPGGVVQLRARSLEPAQWCVEIEDQGIGISEPDLQRLFAPFVQLSTGSCRAYGGTGMGLALARKIAQSQGGDVHVRSQQRVGSVFTLSLPRVLTVRHSSPHNAGSTVVGKIDFKPDASSIPTDG